MNKISVIIGHSDIDQTRHRNLLFSLEYYSSYFNNCEIIVVEQGTKVDLSRYSNVKHVHLNPNHSYSRSLGFNEGFKICSSQIILFVDNDCIISKITLDTIRTMMETSFFELYDVVIPYRWVYDLSEDQTLEIIRTHDVTGNLSKRSHNGRPIINFGGATVLTRNAFISIGGFDPQFVGWGGEDIAFISKCFKMLSVYRVPNNYDMYHLNHYRVYAKAKNPEADKNRNEALRIQNMDENEMTRYIAQLGNSHIS